MPASVEAVCVDPKHVNEIWPHVRQWIILAYQSNSSDETFEDTEKDVLDGKAFLWIAVENNRPIASAVSKIWTFKTKKICSVLAVGGSADDWSSLLVSIEKYAKIENCFSVRLEGRKGWLRVFRDYTQPWITLEKRL